MNECDSWSKYFPIDEAKVSPYTKTEWQLQSIWAMACSQRPRTGSISLRVTDVFRHPVLSDMVMLIDQTAGEASNIVSKYEPFSTLTTGGSVWQSLEPPLSLSGNIIDAAPTIDLQSLPIATSLRKSRDLMA